MTGSEILVIGSGSWATALVKILHDAGRVSTIHWYVRKRETAESIMRNAVNRDYGTGFPVPLHKVKLWYKDMPPPACSLALHAVPSAYSHTWYSENDWKGIKPSVVISAAKGIVPETRQTTLHWLKTYYPSGSLMFLGGPCHSEEVLREARSYLTLGAPAGQPTAMLADLFTTSYLTVSCIPYPEALELFGVLKNIMAIAVGVALGLNYGDNFVAILVAAAYREMMTMAANLGQLPDSKMSAHGGFLGDLLVTCFSPHSRNRRFGFLMAQGHKPDEALALLHMVPEGYYVINSWKQNLDDTQYPIAQALVDILLKNQQAREVFKKLENVLNP